MAEPFIDAHHHLWDPCANPHPWLAPDAAIPFRYGEYDALKRPFLVSDFRALAEPHGLLASITMEGEWDPGDPLGEVRWLASVREPDGVGAAHVAQAWLTAPDLDEVLGALAGFGFVRSVRHKPAAAARHARLSEGHPASLTDPAFATGYGMLAQYGLGFDLQVPWWHLADARRLAARHPEVPLVLNHAGLPADRSAQELAAWHAALVDLAGLAHAFVKISGLGEPATPWSAERNREVVLRTIDAFGADRTMFASNFPVDGLCGSYATIIEGFRTIVADFPPDDRRALFAGNAARIYRLAAATDALQRDASAQSPAE